MIQTIIDITTAELNNLYLLACLGYTIYDNTCLRPLLLVLLPTPSAGDGDSKLLLCFFLGFFFVYFKIVYIPFKGALHATPQLHLVYN